MNRFRKVELLFYRYSVILKQKNCFRNCYNNDLKNEKKVNFITIGLIMYFFLENFYLPSQNLLFQKIQCTIFSFISLLVFFFFRKGPKNRCVNVNELKKKKLVSPLSSLMGWIILTLVRRVTRVLGKANRGLVQL